MTNNFNFIKELGQGSFGQVNLVERKKDNKMYAIKYINVKKMNQQSREFQLNEIRILASIYHPNILSFYETFVQDGKLHIVLEYADGGDLQSEIEQRIKTKQYFKEDEILSILVQCLCGLNYLHSNKIIHRDIKGQNILKFKNPNDESRPFYKIADFGISKVLHSQYELAHSFIGTPLFMAPEIWLKQDYNDKTDIYSLGCVLYQLYTLKFPFDCENRDQLEQNVLKGKYKPISETQYSSNLQKLLYQMLAINASMRPSVKQILELEMFSSYDTSYDLNSEQNNQNLLQTIQLNKQVQQAMNGMINTVNELPEAVYEQRQEFQDKLLLYYQEQNNRKQQIDNISYSLESLINQLPTDDRSKYLTFNKLFDNLRIVYNMFDQPQKQYQLKIKTINDLIRIRIKNLLDKSSIYSLSQTLVLLKYMATYIPIFSQQIEQQIDNLLDTFIKTDCQSIFQIVDNLLLNTSQHLSLLILHDHSQFKFFTTQLRNTNTLKFSINYVLKNLKIIINNNLDTWDKSQLIQMYQIFIEQFWILSEPYCLYKTQNGLQYQQKVQQLMLNDFCSTQIKVQLLTYIFAYWTRSNLSNQSQTDQVTGQINQCVKFFQPHPAQVIAIFCLLGITDQNMLSNQFLQINPGEGKSTAIAITSIVLSILGYNVYCAHLSQQNSQKDYDNFSCLFKAFNVENRINYGTIDQVCEKLVKNDTQIDSILLVEEVDALFDLKFIKSANFDVSKTFKHVMGVTSVLDSLNSAQLHYLASEYYINKFCYIPSIYGESKLQFSNADVQIVDSNHFSAITTEIFKRSRGKIGIPIFVCFESAEKLYQFYNQQIKFLNAHVNILSRNSITQAQSMIPHTVTLVYDYFGSGSDFIQYDKIINEFGVHVIQTYLTDKVNQTRNQQMTARSGANGSFSMVLLQSEIDKFGKWSGEEFSELEKKRDEFYSRKFGDRKE
ncbi:Kinase [Hexamita inflata]|uniref:non-specific serine/threonine protein kinase n=1 Tax=Hexamita inflata TaxID=28002 RepID=A0ABP1H484_9EUKA